ncbi:MAG: AAA family ATPase, partial [Candidatus Dadabacteria bacterium]|nr:AAA family ATPase [Candidatus Dadabacteria bacterium]
LSEDYNHYLDLAYQYIHPTNPALIITHGLSASGKTTCTQKILEELGAVRIRSDIERKRLHGITEYAESGSKTASGLYSKNNTERTY